MKKITMNYKEFNLFKEIANFFFDFTVSKGNIVVEANAAQLEALGY
jgi:hypothetical protein